MAVPHPKIAITGDIGSGKSEVCRLLAAATGYPTYSTGQMQREIADRLGMTTLELNRYSESHPEIDQEIDGRSMELGGRDESFLIDSRIAWRFIPQSFKVFLSVDLRTAAERILGAGRRRERYASLDDAMRDIGRRRRSENERFLETYGIDQSDLGNYDLVVDTSDKTPGQVADEILGAFRAWRDAA